MEYGLFIFILYTFLYDIYQFYNHKRIKMFIKALKIRFTVTNDVFFRTLDQNKDTMSFPFVIMQQIKASKTHIKLQSKNQQKVISRVWFITERISIIRRGNWGSGRINDKIIVRNQKGFFKLYNMVSQQRTKNLQFLKTVI